MSESQASEPERKVYTGRSSLASFRPEDPEGPSLDKAIRHAYEQGVADQSKTGRPGPFSFRVVDIRIEGSNPPSDYKVELADD